MRLLAVVAWLVIWQLASFAVGSRLLLAGPLETVLCLAGLVVRREFWATVAFSLVRIAAGFVASFVLALALASIARRLRVVEEFVAVGLGAVKSVPVVCIVVLLLMFVGSRNVSAVAVFLVALPALYFAAFEALGNLDSGMGELLDACGVRGLRCVLGHVWPSMHPFLVATCKNVVGMSWKAGVAAELVGMPLGSMGERIYQTKLLLETGELFAWTIVVVVLAAVSERAFLALLARSVDVSLHLATRTRSTSGGGASVDEAPLEVRLDDVTVSFEGTEVLSDVNLVVGAGERACLSDPSGSGKTTLLRLLAGILKPDEGAVTVGPEEAPATVSVMSQETHLLEPVSAVGNVAFLAGEWLDETAIRELLLEVLGPDELDRPVSELSGGQRRRVELVRAMARPSGMVLLDEPFASLDASSVNASVAFVMRHLCGRTLVVASHLAGTAALLDARELAL
ncbi:MAG: ATP-binding cassette domain-containing protein [Atopobiaceae bacterium]|nr:ATP-binding cassette domain-containing protein [Atopobiaceae bacterium]